jgi:UDP-N-acetylglucosamine acyltransferase
MSGREVAIHAAASVDPGAELDTGVYVGPGCVIGNRVKVGKGTQFESHVFVGGWTEIGAGCLFSPFSSIGTEPQDVSYRSEETRVKIGDANVFREFITVHRGTAKGGGLTVIGSDNYFMAYSHIAHDCQVGSHTTFTNGATLGGHVTVGDWATVGALSAVHQFCRVGKYAFIGGGSIVTQDILPFCRVAGQRPIHVFGLNVIGLRRKGFSNERIAALKGMFALFFYSDLNTSQACERIREAFPPGEDRDEILSFVEASKRGIVKKTTELWELESG